MGQKKTGHPFRDCPYLKSALVPNNWDFISQSDCEMICLSDFHALGNDKGPLKKVH